MVTLERIREMHTKLQALNPAPEKQDEKRVAGIEGLERKWAKLPISMTDALVTLGIANNAEEAGEFLHNLTDGMIIAIITGTHDAFSGLAAMAKLGFMVGLSMGKKEGVN
jgi:hypothetical protein